MFEVERLTQAVRASGVTMSTSDETLFADPGGLGRQSRLQAIRDRHLHDQLARFKMKLIQRAVFPCGDIAHEDPLI